jgi:hypothetical protein
LLEFVGGGALVAVFEGGPGLVASTRGAVHGGLGGRTCVKCQYSASTVWVQCQYSVSTV